MKKYEVVSLKKDTPELSERGICARMSGTVADVKGDMALVIFSDPADVGGYAVAFVDVSLLKSEGMLPVEGRGDVDDTLSRPDFWEHTSILPALFAEHDFVRLIADRPEYAADGLKKGDVGCIMSATAVGGRWRVIFSDPATGRDTADIAILAADLEKLDS